MTKYLLSFILLISVSYAETPVSKTLQIQILLDRAGFSIGEIDGIAGSNTKKALTVFQQSNGLEPTGKPDDATLQALGYGSVEPLGVYTIRPEDVKGPFVETIPQDMVEMGNLPSLSYTSPLEKIAEKFHISPKYLQKLNPEARFEEGEEIQVPNVDQTLPEEVRNLTITVSEKNSDLAVRSGDGQVLMYAPVTSGSQHDPLPLGKWKVEKIIHDPEFFYNPELFWDADPSHSKARLAPGPNNPVGVVWIDINAEHYGIHGSPDPDKIGHSESYGCVRLTNWDARKLAALILPNTEVIFE